LEHSEKYTSMKEAYHTENIWGKFVVKMWFHLCGLRFPAFMKKSVLLLGQYPNCCWTCTRGLMSTSDSILSLSLLSLLVYVACLASSPWGREIVEPDWIFYSSRWRCRIIFWRFHVWKRELTVKNYRILDSIRAFVLLVFWSSYFYFFNIWYDFIIQQTEIKQNIFSRRKS